MPPRHEVLIIQVPFMHTQTLIYMPHSTYYPQFNVISKNDGRPIHIFFSH